MRTLLNMVGRFNSDTFEIKGGNFWYSPQFYHHARLYLASL